MRRLAAVTLAVVAAALLSGCFRYQSSLVVNDDGSGVVQELLLVDRRVVEAMFDSDADVEAHVPRAADFALPPWVTARDFSDGSFEGVVMDIGFDQPSQLNERLNSLHDLMAANAGSAAVSDVHLERRSGGWDFSMQTADLAAVPRVAGIDASDAAMQYHNAQLVFSLRLPGRLVDHNADEELDGQLVWRVSAQAVQTQLYARTSTSEALATTARTSRTLQLATAAATIGGLAVFAVVARSRPRSSGPAKPATTDPPVERSPDVTEPANPAQWPAVPPAQPPTRRPPPHAGPPPPAG